MEVVEFNSSVTLSQQYAVLGKVAEKIGKIYEKSGDETLVQLSEGYYMLEKEAKYLSKLVKKQLAEYDREILKSYAILTDLDCSMTASTACSAIITGISTVACVWIASSCGIMVSSLLCRVLGGLGCYVRCFFAHGLAIHCVVKRPLLNN